MTDGFEVARVWATPIDLNWIVAGTWLLNTLIACTCNYMYYMYYM